MAGRKTGNAAADVVDEQLAKYRSMRDFSVTAEPSGKGKKTKAAALPFCIQKHAASHLHYDFRLGWNGVLKSWACAKGPSYNVKDKRLAVQVEDHPIEYGGFEGIIPAGQYGGGTVMLWDQGTWQPQAGHEDIDAGLHDGSLKFVMHGTKMKGKWTLIRMGGKAATEKKPNWLLIKEHDEFERGPEDEAVTDAEPKSVVTGRTMEEIAAGGGDHVWNSKATATGDARFRREQEQTEKPRLRKEQRQLHIELEKLPEELQPSFIKPQLTLEAAQPPDGNGWLHELKLDGYRMEARKDGSEVRMLTRSGLDWTARMREIADAVAKLPVDTVTLDGEVVVLAPNGTTNFANLQAAFQEGARNPLTYFCFDLLHLEGHNTRDLPLIERKELLAKILANGDGDVLRLSEHLDHDGVAMFHKACEMHAEGIVSKKANAKYSEGRGGGWLKSKCLLEQEFVVGGYTLPSKGGGGIGALLLGYYESGKLIYAGRTGTGFTQKMSREMCSRMESLETKEMPFAKITAEGKRGAKWVRPETVVQVRFSTWTADEQVRQAAFLGLREDKKPDEVRREGVEVAPMPKGTKRQATHAVRTKVAAKEVVAEKLETAPVRLTHPDKVLDPESGLTKQQLADYYWAVSEKMLPHLKGRAISLVRVPDGIGKPQFYQKHVTSMMPAGFDTVDVTDKKTGEVEKYVGLSTREAIAALAQMSVLEVHPWGSLAKTLEKADRLTFDLDPDETLEWSVLTGAAIDARDRLKELGLQSFVKTTGGKGLHVVVPIVAEMEWPAIKEFCHAFVLTMERANPGLYLTKMTKSARVCKIYLDYLRNERGATAVAPYSPRARANVGVAMPLDWAELESKERPIYRVGNFREWEDRLQQDPWKDFFSGKQMISARARKSVGMAD